jgi:hypothetical protein
MKTIRRAVLAAVLVCAAAACAEPPTAPAEPSIPLPRTQDPAPALPTQPIPGPSPAMIGPPLP